MTDMNQIEIRCNPSNPVNYLACCGIFDLVSRMDASSLAYWETQPPVRFVLRTSLSEHDLVGSLTHTLCSPAHWHFNTPRNTDQVTRIVTVFCSSARSPFRVGLDWWVETLHQDGSIGEKSAWKMYAGQQTVSGIIRDMVAACAGFDSGGASEPRLGHLLDYSVNMTGRFGFDPRSSRNALDVGYSPNDLQMPIATYPFAELLSGVRRGVVLPAASRRSRLVRVHARLEHRSPRSFCLRPVG
jgi:hypothetical protein